MTYAEELQITLAYREQEKTRHTKMALLQEEREERRRKKAYLEFKRERDEAKNDNEVDTFMTEWNHRCRKEWKSSHK